MWHFTNDVEPYAAKVWELLAADPAANTVGLTIIDSGRAGFRWSDVDPTFGWLEDDLQQVRGAVSITPPYPLLLSVVPPEATDELVSGLRAAEVAVEEVHGAESTVLEFARAWSDGTALESEVHMRQRLYTLGELTPPERHPAGRARRAGENDLELVVEWSQAFGAEAGGHHGLSDDWARERIESGTLSLWETEPGTGSVVAMAGRRPASAGVARIGPVYTPPEHRRQGFGTAATVAATREALDAGAEAVVLFTDLANPVSNSIYQSIGYRPVSDRVVLRFTKC